MPLALPVLCLAYHVCAAAGLSSSASGNCCLVQQCILFTKDYLPPTNFYCLLHHCNCTVARWQLPPCKIHFHPCVALDQCRNFIIKNQLQRPLFSFNRRKSKFHSGTKTNPGHFIFNSISQSYLQKYSPLFLQNTLFWISCNFTSLYPP